MLKITKILLLLGAIFLNTTTNANIIATTYTHSSGILQVGGNGFDDISGSGNDIIASSLTIIGDLGSYALTNTPNVDIDNSTQFSITISGIDKTFVDGLLDIAGTIANDGSAYTIFASAGYNGIGSTNTSSTINSVIDNQFNIPIVDSAVYDYSTGVFTVTAEGLLRKLGLNNDIKVNLLGITGQGGDNNRYSFSQTSNIDIASSTQFIISLSDEDKSMVNSLLNKNGISAINNNPYYFNTVNRWNGNSSQGFFGNISSATINVENFASPTITSASYETTSSGAIQGILVVNGENFVSVSGDNNDIDVSNLTLIGEGGISASYTISGADIDIASSTQFRVNIGSNNLPYIDNILNKNGIQSFSNNPYQLFARGAWNGAGANNASGTIIVSGFRQPYILPFSEQVEYQANNGRIILQVLRPAVIGGVNNDLDASKITIIAGLGNYTLVDTPDVDLVGSAFTVILSNTDKLNIDGILNNNGTTSNNNSSYQISFTDAWNGVAATQNILTGVLSVSNYQAPDISSATYDASASILVVSGTNLVHIPVFSATDNDINTSNFTISSVNSSHTLTSADVAITSATLFTISLNNTDTIGINNLLTQNGTSVNGVSYTLSANQGWNGGGATSIVNKVITVVNIIPSTLVFNSADTISVNENQTSVITVTATNTTNDTILFSISGGVDATIFSITTSGVLIFNQAPDYEAPTDSDSDNNYVVIILATDTYGNEVTQQITITVTNTNDSIPVFSDINGQLLTTIPTVQSGNAFIFTVNSANSSVVVGVDRGIGNLVANNQGIYTFDAPTIGSFAGVYTIIATDTNSGIGVAQTIIVPLVISASPLNLFGIIGVSTVTVYGLVSNENVNFTKTGSITLANNSATVVSGASTVTVIIIADGNPSTDNSFSVTAIAPTLPALTNATYTGIVIPAGIYTVRVIDDNNNPINNANLEVIGLNNTTTTNSSGYASFTLEKNIAYIVRASAEGLISVTRTIVADTTTMITLAQTGLIVSGSVSSTIIGSISGVINYTITAVSSEANTSIYGPFSFGSASYSITVATGTYSVIYAQAIGFTNAVTRNINIISPTNTINFTFSSPLTTYSVVRQNGSLLFSITGGGDLSNYSLITSDNNSALSTFTASDGEFSFTNSGINTASNTTFLLRDNNDNIAFVYRYQAIDTRQLAGQKFANNANNGFNFVFSDGASSDASVQEITVALAPDSLESTIANNSIQISLSPIRVNSPVTNGSNNTAYELNIDTVGTTNSITSLNKSFTNALRVSLKLNNTALNSFSSGAMTIYHFDNITDIIANNNPEIISNTTDGVVIDRVNGLISFNLSSLSLASTINNDFTTSSGAGGCSLTENSNN